MEIYFENDIVLIANRLNQPRPGPDIGTDIGSSLFASGTTVILFFCKILPKITVFYPMKMTFSWNFESKHTMGWIVALIVLLILQRLFNRT